MDNKVKGELQGLVLDKDGTSQWKTLHTVEDMEEGWALATLHMEADWIKVNKSKYIEPGQELLNGCILINGELNTMLLMDATIEEERELQEAFDDLIKHEAECQLNVVKRY